MSAPPPAAAAKKAAVDAAVARVTDSLASTAAAGDASGPIP